MSSRYCMECYGQNAPSQVFDIEVSNTFFCVHSGARTVEADARKIVALAEKVAEIGGSKE